MKSKRSELNRFNPTVRILSGPLKKYDLGLLTLGPLEHALVNLENKKIRNSYASKSIGYSENVTVVYAIRIGIPSALSDIPK